MWFVGVGAGHVATAICCAVAAFSGGLYATDARARADEQSTEQCVSLVRLLALPRADLLVNTTQLQARAFDAGDDCVAAVAQHLADTSSMTVGAAAYALSVIGSDQAIAAIHAAVIGAPGDRARASLPVATRPGAGESVLAAQYFSAAMEGPRLGPGWIPRHNAALTLGVLRAREGSDALRTAAAAEGSGTFVAQAAAAALSWMDRMPCSLEDASSRDAITSVSLATLLCGVPIFLSSTPSFLEQKYDGSPLRVWSFSERGWSFRPATSADNRMYPRMQFRTTFSSDSSRATSNVHTSGSAGNLTVYKYLFRKTGTAWRVIAIAFGGVA